jgi:hypothetical protein
MALKSTLALLAGDSLPVFAIVLGFVRNLSPQLYFDLH